MKLTVLGAGALGTALAASWASQHAVTLWGRNARDLDAMRASRVNSHYLPDCPLPPALAFNGDFDLALENAELVDGLWTVRQAPPKQEIARMIGASREMVSRVVKDLQQRGYIRTEKRKVFLLDKVSMAKRAST